MTTAIYQGRRVQVVHSPAAYDSQYPDEKLVIIREIGVNIIAGVDSTLGVELNKLSDYQESEEA